MENSINGFGKETSLKLQSACPVRVWLLGEFRVTVGSRTVGENDWRRQKSAQLIKLLALAPEHQVHRERAAELLWPEMHPQISLNNLNRELYEARKVLQPHDPTAELCLRLRNRWLSLCPGGSIWTDVEAFEKAVVAARRMGTSVAYERALELYPGELLPRDRYEGWIESRRTVLQETYLWLLLELAGLLEKLRRPHLAIKWLERAIFEDPTHELAYEALMRLYAGIGWRQRALKKYEVLREHLAEFRCEPANPIQRLQRDILAGKALGSFGSNAGAVLPKVPDSQLHNLPRPLQTSFIGREQKLAEVKRALTMTGLLTLTGTGGSGKTRLALEAARELVGVYPDGVWFVELSPLANAELVLETASNVLGLAKQSGPSTAESLLENVGDKELLLLLDNCEHLVEESAQLCSMLLDGCPGLRILATSREALNVPGELRLVVPPLPLPETGWTLTLEELGSYGSTQLLVERVSHRTPGFTLSSQNAGAVVNICQNLEGMPLALELAAARVATLGANEVASMLEGSLSLLSTGRSTAPARQGTLRSVLDWSHGLLEEPERKLFRRLAVFRGGWTLEAAQAIACSDEGDGYDVPGSMHELVEKSLVIVETATHRRRYRFLEPVRQYALEHLEVSPDLARTCGRHARWFLDFASHSYDEVLGSNRGAWLELLEADNGNFRAALAWSFEGGNGETGLQLVAALRYFWSMRGYLQEGRRWLERGLQVGGTKLSRARAQDTLGTIAVFQADYDLARELSEQSIILYREIEDIEGMASSLINLGFCATLGMKNTAALPDYVEESERLKQLVRDPRMVGFMILFEGLALGFWGNLSRAQERFAASLALHKEIGEIQGMGLARALTGLVALAKGEDDEAEAIFSSMLPHAREFGDGILIFYCLWGLACAIAARYPSHAANLWGTVQSMQETRGIGVPTIASRMAGYERRRGAAIGYLGPVDFDAQWAAGKAMSEDEAISQAISDPPTQNSQPLEDAREAETEIPRRDPVKLTRREKEVAELVTAGLTNRRISERLYISPRTADTHVGRILKKLGASSREQVAELLEGI